MDDEREFVRRIKRQLAASLALGLLAAVLTLAMLAGVIADIAFQYRCEQYGYSDVIWDITTPPVCFGVIDGQWIDEPLSDVRARLEVN